jgi:hypothetical protein
MYLGHRKGLYALISLVTILLMPRKPTIQPAPLKSFTLDDGTVVEVRDHNTREIGPGLDKKFNSEELDWQVLNGLVEDLQSGNDTRIKRANTAIASNHAMARYLLDGGYDYDERTCRRHGKAIREKYAQTMRIVGAVEYDSWKVHSAPCQSS